HFVSLKVSASSSVNAVHKSCLRSFPAFIFNDTPTTVIYTLSLHDALPISVQFFRRAADRRGAGDDAHAIGQLQLVERVAKLVPLFALDSARDAAAARIVWHQDQVASRQADEGGQRRPLRAALVLLDLDDQLLAFAQRILDAGAADVDVRLEIAAGDFLEREEPVPLLAVVDEGGFETGLDAGDDAFVDVALALLP